MSKKKRSPEIIDAEIVNGAVKFGFTKNIRSAPTREWKISEIEGEPVLTLAIADTNLNSDLQNATLVDLSQQHATGALVVPPGEDSDMEERLQFVVKNRETDRRLFPYGVIIGWDKNPPVDTDGNPVPFTRENCIAFVQALPDAVFDTIRIVARAREGFDLLTDMADVEGISKN